MRAASSKSQERESFRGPPVLKWMMAIEFRAPRAAGYPEIVRPKPGRQFVGSARQIVLFSRPILIFGGKHFDDLTLVRRSHA
jgi:hypothetical protein